jgi:hypothetical protein
LEGGVGGVIVALALALIVLVCEFASGERKPYGEPSGIDAMRSTIEGARKIASSTVDGVTIEVSPLSGDRAHVEVHLHRPTSTMPVDPNPEAPAELQANVTMASDAGGSNGGDFAIFISPHGAVSASAWTPAMGQLAAEPACVNPIVLTFTNDGTVQNLNLSCTDASISEADVR